ncbi:MAG: hypothetical protein H6740_15520 [Alphaproteobacteria bacterium]|nr:hypothetical protein [Alphaproteobacteria bacterium]
MRRTILLCALALAGCASTHVYRASGDFELEPATQIDDADILRAFEARPQLPEAPRVALYSFDADRALALSERLSVVEGVAGTYTIPPFMVTGQRRFQEHAAAPTEPLSLEKLRLLAARAHCELLVVADHGWRRSQRANGLAAFNVLLLPALFTPFLDVELESYLDLYVLDVRNGFLYGQVSAEELAAQRFTTIWRVEDEGALDASWEALLAAAGAEVEGLLEG